MVARRSEPHGSGEERLQGPQHPACGLVFLEGPTVLLRSVLCHLFPIQVSQAAALWVP